MPHSGDRGKGKHPTNSGLPPRAHHGASDDEDDEEDDINTTRSGRRNRVGIAPKFAGAAAHSKPPRPGPVSAKQSARPRFAPPAVPVRTGGVSKRVGKAPGRVGGKAARQHLGGRDKLLDALFKEPAPKGKWAQRPAGSTGVWVGAGSTSRGTASAAAPGHHNSLPPHPPTAARERGSATPLLFWKQMMREAAGQGPGGAARAPASGRAAGRGAGGGGQQGKGRLGAGWKLDKAIWHQSQPKPPLPLFV